MTHDIFIRRKRLRRDGLEEVLRAYAMLADRSFRLEGDDPFQYTEQSCTTLLASAASVCGWAALSEWQTSKRCKLDRRKDVDGRADLWLQPPSGRDGYIAEAKHGYAGIVQGALALERLESLETAARDDIASTCFVRGKGNDDRGIAVAFCNIHYHVDDTPTDEAWLEALRTYLVRADAWLVYRRGESFEGWSEQHRIAAHCVVIFRHRRAA